MLANNVAAGVSQIRSPPFNLPDSYSAAWSLSCEHSAGEHVSSTLVAQFKTELAPSQMRLDDPLTLRRRVRGRYASAGDETDGGSIGVNQAGMIGTEPQLD